MTNDYTSRNPGPVDTSLDPVTGEAPFDTDVTWATGAQAGTNDGITAAYPVDSDYDVSDTEDVDDTDDELVRSREQIEQTRLQMSSTIDAIQEKLSPTNIAQEAKDAVHDATIGRVTDAISNVTGSATEAVSNAFSGATDTVSSTVSSVGDFSSGIGSTIVETIRNNPIPAALTGLGLGWLIMSARKNSSQASEYRYRPSSSQGYDRSYGRESGYSADYQGRYGYTSGYPAGSTSGQYETSGSSGSGISDKVSNVQSAAGDALGTVGDQAGQVASQVQDTAGQVVETAQYRAQQAGTSFQELMHDRPLAVGALSIALGAAVGLAIPNTSRENLIMGEARENLVGQAQETAHETIQKVQSVAGEAVDAAQDAAQQAAQRQGLSS